MKQKQCYNNLLSAAKETAITIAITEEDCKQIFTPYTLICHIVMEALIGP